MKNLFDPAAANQIKTRLAQLTPQSPRQWGKMTPAQMLAYCALGMQWAVGGVVPERGPWPMRLVGRLIKPFVLRDDAPLRKDAPTAKSLVMTDSHNFQQEREQLLLLIDKFAAGAVTEHPHTFFGSLTPDEWAVLTYKHLDHHLRQFSV